MELTIEHALQIAVEAHRVGKLHDAEALYRAILQTQPKHPDANHNLGVMAVSLNKTAAAIPLFKIALEANPNQGQFWLSYVNALIKERQFEDAKNILEQGKKRGLAGEKVDALEAELTAIFSTENLINLNQIKNPSKIELNTLLEHYKKGRYDLAQSLATTLTEQYPDHPFGWKVLGALFEKVGKLQDSLHANQKVLEISPNDVDTHYNLGNTLKELGRLEDAERSYKKAILIKPDYAEAHSNLGNTLKELGRLEEAETSYKKAIAIKPDYAEAHSNLGNTLKELGRLDDAETSYKKAIAIKPDYAQAHSNLGITLQELGRLDDAETSYRKAIAIQPDLAEVHSNLGNTLQELGRLEDAETSYKKAIAIKPDYAEAHSNLGNTLKKLGRLLDAETSYKKAVAIKPDYAEAHSNLGITLQELGRLLDAETSYKKAIAIKPDLAEAHSNLGITLQDLGKLEDAEISYKKAIAIKPDYADAHSNLGNTLKELGKLLDAETSYKKAIAIKPDLAEVHSNLGITLNELGKLEDAETSYKKAIAIQPGYAEVHSNLGITLQELGRLEDAEASYKKAIALKPNLLEAFSNLSLTLIFLDKLNEATQVLQKIIEIDPDGYGLKACVDLAILNFLNGNRSSSKLLLLNSNNILKSKKTTFKNEIAYWNYLSILLVGQQNEIQNEIDRVEIQKLYVIGESHSLASHETCIKKIQSQYLCQSFWIVGCKQWHLGNTLENKYKYKFQKIIQCIPFNSNILLSIGEIDCRIDEGILSHIKKHPAKDKTELINSTINNYLKYIFKLLSPFSHEITIQGVPCPNIIINNKNKEDFSNLIDLIKEFNVILKKQAHFYGFNFLDLHKLTDSGDGFSNGKWHIDQHHLSPAGMQEAWLTCFISHSE